MRWLMLVLILAVLGSGIGVASASPLPLWMAKSNDLALLQGAIPAAGITRTPIFGIDGCGGLSDPLACVPGQQPIETSYWDLRNLAVHHYHGIAVFDIETWAYTPASQRADPLKFICLAGSLARRMDPGMQVLVAPFNPSPSFMTTEDATAARCGAWGVDIQAQFANDHPQSSFRPFVRTTIAAIRHASLRTTILVGLATNTPHVTTVPDLVADYRIALSYGAQGFWLNANDWGSRSQCTAAQGGPGCPVVAWQFLGAIGAAS